MKVLLPILFILSLIPVREHELHEKKLHSPLITTTNSCPPFYEETKSILKDFLTEDSDQDERQKLGIEGVSMNEIIYLRDNRDSMACQEIRQISDWPLEDYYRTYYKSNNFYFIVDATKPPPPAEEGKINIRLGHNLIIILDEEFNPVGSVIE